MGIQVGILVQEMLISPSHYLKHWRVQSEYEMFVELLMAVLEKERELAREEPSQALLPQALGGGAVPAISPQSSPDTFSWQVPVIIPLSWNGLLPAVPSHWAPGTHQSHKDDAAAELQQALGHLSSHCHCHCQCHPGLHHQ